MEFRTLWGCVETHWLLMASPTSWFGSYENRSRKYTSSIAKGILLGTHSENGLAELAQWHSSITPAPQEAEEIRRLEAQGLGIECVPGQTEQLSEIVLETEVRRVWRYSSLIACLPCILWALVSVPSKAHTHYAYTQRKGSEKQFLVRFDSFTAA